MSKVKIVYLALLYSVSIYCVKHVKAEDIYLVENSSLLGIVFLCCIGNGGVTTI